jgi:hypothetical protein
MRIVCAVVVVAATLAAIGVGCGKKVPVFPNCGDNVTNGEETDVDCGGRICPPCNTGKQCLVDKDCLSLVCAAGTCAAPTCSDGVLNNSESDTDCGGPNCAGDGGAPCATARICAGNNDCASHVCTGGTCQAPSCGDGVTNGDEAGVDCGGSCPPCDAAVSMPPDLLQPTD